jgi:hypothetical protein
MMMTTAPDVEAAKVGLVWMMMTTVPVVEAAKTDLA